MKKMTFAVWFTALLAVFTFSSCLDDETGGQRQGSEIVKVVGMLGNYEFQSAGGFTLVPSNMSALTMDISTKFAFITYTFDTEALDQNTKKVPIQLNGIMPIRPQYINPTKDGMKEFSNAPIRNITTGGSYEFFPVSFWDTKTMFLPITYFIKDYGDNKELQKEVDSHTFSIYYDENDLAAGSVNLVLQVRHHVADPSLNKDRRSRYNTNIYEVDLTYALDKFQQNHGHMPSNIILKFEENFIGEYEESQLSEGKAEINYQAILDAAKR